MRFFLNSIIFQMEFKKSLLNCALLYKGKHLFKITVFRPFLQNILSTIDKRNGAMYNVHSWPTIYFRS